MSAAHTPGPWHVGGREKCTIYDKLGQRIANSFEGVMATQRSDVECANNARLIAAAPLLLAEVEREYTELADFRNQWPGRHTMGGQAKLIRLRDLIVAATGRDARDVQDDYGTRAARGQA